MKASLSRGLRRVTAVSAITLLVVSLTATGQSAAGARPATPQPGPKPTQRTGSAAGLPHLVAGGENTVVPTSQRGKYPAVALPKPSPTADRAKLGTAAAPTPTGFVPGRSVEDATRRTSNSRLYANADGSQTTEFSATPMNYQDGKGNWQPIDPNLAASSDGGLKAGGGAADVRLATHLGASQLSELTLDAKHSVGWSAEASSDSTASVDGSTVTYRNLAADADLQLTALPAGVKETIVLRSAQAPSSYTFPLQLTGLTARLHGRGVLLVDEHGTTRATIPAGSMQETPSGSTPPAVSSGVTYQLTGAAPHQQLRVTLDQGWLHDPTRRFPVDVDPTVLTGGTSYAYQWGGWGLAHAFEVGLNAPGDPAQALVSFPDTIGSLDRQHIFGAQLSLVNFNSASCSPRPITVYGALDGGNQNSMHYADGPRVGAALASSNFAYGHVAPGASSSACPAKTTLINLGVAGRDFLQGWANDYTTDHGLVIRASATDPLDWKYFAADGANAPKLYVTHSPYSAKYAISDPVPKPAVLQNQDGAVKVTVVNTGSVNWTASDYYLAYRVYNSAGKLLSIQKAASLPRTIYGLINDQLTLNATIKALPAGTYSLDFTMVHNGGPVFTDDYVPPARLVLTVYNVPPVVTGLYPQNGYGTPTLTPQLWAKAYDVDAATGLTYQFTVTPAGGTAFSSGFISSSAWVPPAGKLVWNKSYSWTATVKDSTGATTTVGPVTLLTNVPQPDITSRLAGAASGDARDFDPLIGNYTTSAIDAPVVTSGPPLSVARTYNSLDPRSGGLFGAGWSSLYDMKVVTELDGSGNVVVTLETGRDVRFGKNPDGSYVAPPGETLALTLTSGTWTLRDQGGLTYSFPQVGASAGKLTSIQGLTGRPLSLTYDAAGKLATATSGNSSRTLTFTWSGAHVASVAAAVVNGSAPTWAYTYAGDNLTKVCAPGNSCTSYGYSAGSHYRSAVLDAKPDSYWRLDETEDPDADTQSYNFPVASQVEVNLGSDTGHLVGDDCCTAGTVRQRIAGWPGALAGTSNTSARLAASHSDLFAWPQGEVKRSRDGAIEMWFNTTTPVAGALMGYEAQDPNSAKSITSGWPILYIGADGKLRGQFRTATINPITSNSAVNDGAWHHVVLSAMGDVQTLYLDGATVGSLTGTIDHSTMTYAQIGRAYVPNPQAFPSYCFIGGGVTCADDTIEGISTGLDEPALYSHPLSAAEVADHYRLGRTASQELTSVTLPSGKVAATITYDTDNDRVSEYTDANGGTWKIGNPVVSGGTTDLRRTVLVRDPADRIYLYEYDALTGQMLRTGSPTGVTTREEDRTCTVPTPKDPAFCAGETDPGQTAGSVVFDADGLAIRSYVYDATGHLTRVYDEVGDYVDMAYDARGNMVSRTTCRSPNPTPQCSTTRNTFPSVTDPLDPRGSKPTETRDGRSSGATDDRYRTQYSYDPAGNLLSETGPDTATASTTYSVGTEAATAGGTIPSGLPLTSTDPRGAVTTFGYSSAGDLTKITEPSGLVTVFGYDALGRKTSEAQTSDTYPGGVTTTYAYDALSRLTSTTQPATTDGVSGVRHQLQVVDTYDADSNVVQTTQKDLLGGDAARVATYDFDDHNHVDRTTDSQGNETSNAYDAYGNRTSTVDANGVETDFAYTARNAIAEVRLDDPYGQGNGTPGSGGYLVLASYGYDLAGRIVRETDAMGRTVTTQYYNDGLVQRRVLKGFHKPDGTTADDVLEDDTYDGAGNLIKQISDNGTRTSTATYDAAGRVAAAVADPNGLKRTTSYTYDPSGNQTKVVTSGASSNITPASTAAQTVTYAYDAAGRRTSQSLDLGNGTSSTTTVAYDQRGLPASTTSPLGNVTGADAATRTAYTTNYSYDQLAQLTQAAQPQVTVSQYGASPTAARPTTSTGYDSFGEQTSTRDPRGNVATATYNDLGQLSSQSLPAYTPPGATTAITPKTTTSYDAVGRLSTQTDALGHQTRYQYDRFGNTTSVDATAPNGTDRAVTNYTYTRGGLALSVTDPSGARTEATYDDLDRKITSTVVERTPTVQNLTTAYRYDDAGDLVGVTSPLGVASSATYDTFGQLTKAADGTGVAVRYGYDALGRQASTTDALSRTTGVSYDPAGRPVATADFSPSGTQLRSQSATYDAAGDLVQSTPAVGRPTTYTYDALGRLTGQTEPVNATTSIGTSVGYDASGDPTRYTDGRGNATWYTFNSLGLPESQIEPSTATAPAAADRTWTATYDAAGQVVKTVKPGGVSSTASYDAIGDLTSETGTIPAAGSVSAQSVSRSVGYDVLGRPVSAGTPSGKDTYSYDDRGQLVSAGGPSGSATYSYDNDGQLVARTDAAGSAAFTYANDRLATTTDPISHAVLSYGYNADGSVKTVGYSAGQSRNLGYDDLGRLATDDVVNSAGSTLASVHYGYDPEDRVTSKVTAGVAGAGANAYGYDDVGRLTTWAVAGGATTTYGYDAASNRTSVNATASTYDERNRQLTSGSSTFAYSARGTLASKTAGSTVEGFQFDAFDRLVGDGTKTYSYDDLDRVVSAGGKAFAYDGQSSDLVADGTQTFGRGPAGGLLSDAQGTAKQLLTTDAHGDVLAGFDATNGAATSTTSSRSYDPWGRTVTSTGTGADLGYQGAWTDPTTSQVDMNARWYDPGQGSFDSQDSLTYSGGPSPGANGYLYGNGDPVTMNDPTGHYAKVPPGVGVLVDTAETVAKDNPIGLLLALGVGVGAGMAQGQSPKMALGNSLMDIVPGERWALGKVGQGVDEMASSIADLSTEVQHAADQRADQQYVGESLMGQSTAATQGLAQALDADTAAVGRVTTATQGVTGALKDLTATYNNEIRGLQQVDRKLDGIGKQLDAIGARLGALDAWLDGALGSAQANQRALDLVSGGRLSVPAAATRPVYAGAVVPANPSLPAAVVQGAFNLTKDQLTATQAIYQTAVGAAGSVIQGVSLASQASTVGDPTTWQQGGSVEGVASCPPGSSQAACEASVQSSGVNTYLGGSCHSGGQQGADGGRSSSVWTCDSIDPSTTQEDRSSGAADTAGKIPWNSYADYAKVTQDGREYAQVGDRLYTQHAVDRMQPSGLGAPAGATGAGRSISPNFVEGVIRTGTPSQSVVDGVTRTIYSSGTVQVVTENGGQIVVTVLTK